MAYQVPRETMLANFKPTRTQKMRAKAAHDPRANRDGDCEKHRAAVRTLPCSIPSCNRVGGVDPHHLKQTGERGAALRSPDKYAVPLCREHHEEIERAGSKNELRWFEVRGIEVLGLAAALWGIRGNAGAMARIIIANKKAGMS